MRKTIEYYKKKEKELKPLITNILHNHKRNKLNLIGTYGAPGLGKSYLNLRAVEILYPILKGKPLTDYKGYLDKFLVQNAMQFLDAVENAEPGDIIIMEEASNWINSKTWMTKENLAVGDTMDMIRKLKLVLFMNTPSIIDIDKRILRLMGYSVEPTTLNKQTGICKSHPLYRENNFRIGKLYHHGAKDKRGRRLQEMWNQKPSREFCELYEERKVQKLKERIGELRTEQKFKKEKKNKEIKSVLGTNAEKIEFLPIQQKKTAESFIKNRNLENVERVETIAKELNKSPRAVYDSLKRIKEKGINLNNL